MDEQSDTQPDSLAPRWAHRAGLVHSSGAQLVADRTSACVECSGGLLVRFHEQKEAVTRRCSLPTAAPAKLELASRARTIASLRPTRARRRSSPAHERVVGTLRLATAAGAHLRLLLLRIRVVRMAECSRLRIVLVVLDSSWIVFSAELHGLVS